ncbi:MAG: DUF2306 domain-containing protein [Bacteroidota bacterium]
MNGYHLDPLGMVHLASAVGAMILGALAVFLKKGTTTHVRIGYGYFFAMLTVNITALMIYRLFGSFGAFHIMALISLLTLLGGLIPAYLKKPTHSWLELHYEFMNWSIVGLYAAFWSETFSRFFRFAGFWTFVATATALTVAVGIYFIKRYKKSLIETYSREPGAEMAPSSPEAEIG